jgi:hypothetical protein
LVLPARLLLLCLSVAVPLVCQLFCCAVCLDDGG